VSGKVYGGDGDDIYVLGGSVSIVERKSEGTDTVQIRYSYTLGANIENLQLTGKSDTDGVGNGLANVITGNKGDNHLTGKGGDDIFVFLDNFGHDTVTDFSAGHDQLDLSDVSGMSSYAALKAHMAQSGADVVISLDSGDTITLSGVTLSDLHKSDFIL